MDESSFSPGDDLAGKYEVVRPLGSGGMGQVYEGRHKALGKRVAIKVLREEAAQHPEYRQRFEREARAAASLVGPHVAQVTDVETLDDGRPFIVMEYLEGQDLNAELEARGTFPIAEAVDYVLQTCSAMTEAHARGIVHRDLKPHNLYLTEHRDGRRLKVLDFGISKVDEGDASVTSTSVAMGTPLYMAPEQMRSAKHVDARADIWSLGVILYELLVGRPPFDGSNPTAVIAAVTADTPVALRDLRPDVPEALDRVVMQMLEKNKDRRPGSVLEVGQLLAPFSTSGVWEPNAPLSSLGRSDIPMPAAPTSAVSVEGMAATARRDTAASWSTHGARQARRRRLTTSAVLAAGLLVVAGVASAIWLTRDHVPAGPPPPVAAPGPVAEPPPVEDQDIVPEPEPEASSSQPAEGEARPSATSMPSARPVRRLPQPRPPVAKPRQPPPPPPPPLPPPPPGGDVRPPIL